MPLDSLFAAPIGALVIGLLRVTDVSMAMTRMLLAVRGHRVLAALIGFFEVLIWLVAVGKAIEHMHSAVHVIGYATGFATGNYVGIWLEERFALGTNVVHAVIRRSSNAATRDERAVSAARRLRTDGFAVTELEGMGLHSSVDILNVVVARRSVPRVVHVIRESDPEAFVSVEEVRSVQGGHMGPAGRKMPSFGLIDVWRKRPKVVPGPVGARAAVATDSPIPGPVGSFAPVPLEAVVAVAADSRVPVPVDAVAPEAMHTDSHGTIAPNAC